MTTNTRSPATTRGAVRRAAADDPPRASSHDAATKAPARPSLAARAARALLLSRLDRMRAARVHFIDPVLGDVTFGEGGAPERTATVRVHDPAVYARLLLGGSIAAGETYRDGLWSTDDLTALTRAFVKNRQVLLALDGRLSSPLRAVKRVAHALRRNTRRGSRRNIEAHYDLDGRFFALFLDPSMTYSSGVFATPRTTLAEAQSAKYERLCRKLGLRAGQRVLEIGCGWGGFALHAARHHGADVHAVTISPSQFGEATARVARAGLERRVRVELCDYRDLRGRYDAIVSIEMIEAVGAQYYDTYFAACARLLEPGGALAMQAITMPDAHYRRARRSVDFIQAHVFPGSTIPSVTALSTAAGRAGKLRLDQLEDLTSHYVTTLHAWRDRLAQNSEAARALGHGPDFQRLWQFYLAYCAGGFAERAINLVQIVFGMPEHRPTQFQV